MGTKDILREEKDESSGQGFQVYNKTIGSPTPTSLRMAEENHLYLGGSLTRRAKWSDRSLNQFCG